MVARRFHVKYLILLYLWRCSAGGAKGGREGTPSTGGERATSSIYLGLSDFCGELKPNRFEVEMYR